MKVKRPGKFSIHYPVLAIRSAGLIFLALSVLCCPFRSLSFEKPSGLDAGIARVDSKLISTTTPAGRLAVFDDVWQTIYDRYYDAKFHGVDWWAQRSLFRHQAAEARGVRELYTVLRRLVAPLRDAHTRVYGPEEKFDWQHPRFVTIGLSLRDIEGQITVVAVAPASPAERAHLRAGDTIETIDGESATARLEQRLREQAGSSTPQAARLFALASLLDGPPETNVSIEWKNATGQVSRASLRREWQERDFKLRLEQQRGISVVTIDVFTPGLALEFAQVMNRRPAKAAGRGIVLDLRNNGGGDAEAMAEIASYFLPLGTRLGDFTDRHGNAVLNLETGSTALLTARQIEPLQGPIVILTSERTSSAAEIFVSALKQHVGATILGSRTCGCVLAVRMRHALPDGGELEVSELDYRTALGVRLEGQGITPDEVIALTRQDVYSGHDRILQTAFARLKSR